jgi:hypothetical protein
VTNGRIRPPAISREQKPVLLALQLRDFQREQLHGLGGEIYLLLLEQDYRAEKYDQTGHRARGQVADKKTLAFFFLLIAIRHDKFLSVEK